MSFSYLFFDVVFLLLYFKFDQSFWCVGGIILNNEELIGLFFIFLQKE